MIKKRQLLLLASVVWLIAGFNVLKIGLDSYVGLVNPLNLLMSLAIFIIFWLMVFSKLTKKHTTRITGYTEEKQLFIKFFDRKSFIIMAVMITGGITIRVLHLLPLSFIAVFYSGLGSALFLAGILFGYNYFIFNRK